MTKKWISRGKTRVAQIWNSGGIHVIFGNFFNKFVVFFGSIFVVRFLSKENYGILSYMENLYNFVYIIAGLGVSNAILRYVVLEDDIKRKHAIFSFLSKVAICTNCILIVVCCIVNYNYPHESQFESEKYLLYVMLLMLPAQYANDNCLTLQRAMFDNRRFSYFNFAYAAAVILGKCLGASIGNLTALVIIGVLIQYIYLIVVKIGNEKKYFKNIGISEIKKTEKKVMLGYSFQYMITNGIWSLFMLMDVFLLGKMINDATIIADYKIAYTWPANISIVCAAIGMFISPYFVKNETDSVWVKKNFLRVFSVNFVFVLCIAIVMFLAAKPLIFIYGGTEYYNVVPLMRLILIGAVINNGCRYMIANCLAAMGKIKANMLVSFFGMVAQIIFNVLLIPKYGIYGPAYTGIMVYSFMAIVLFVVFNYRYRLIGGSAK